MTPKEIALKNNPPVTRDQWPSADDPSLYYIEIILEDGTTYLS